VIKIHSISRINFPHNILPSLVLSNALALELRHGQGLAGHGGPLFFFSGQAPEARPARCPMLTCNGRSCKCTSPAMAGYRPVKVYLVLSLGCNDERKGARVQAQGCEGARMQARGCEGASATVRGCEGATARARLRRRGSRAYCIPYMFTC
jgi:hypothetical protein